MGGIQGSPGGLEKSMICGASWGLLENGSSNVCFVSSRPLSESDSSWLCLDTLLSVRRLEWRCNRHEIRNNGPFIKVPSTPRTWCLTYNNDGQMISHSQHSSALVAAHEIKTGGFEVAKSLMLIEHSLTTSHCH